MELEEKLSNCDFIDALSAQDYDIQNYLWSMLTSILSVTDVPGVFCGTESDLYSFGGRQYLGDQYSFVELAYENEWPIVSLKPVDLENISSVVTKNGDSPKTVYSVCDLSQLYFIKALTNGQYLGEYFTSFDKVYCVRNCTFDHWDSVHATGRFKVLATFYREIRHIVHNEFDKLGRFPGRKANRVEKINDNLFEYRIANPNYRIYYTRKEDKIVIVLSALKRRGNISASMMNNLMQLKNYTYEKPVT